MSLSEEVHITNDFEKKIADAFDIFDHAGNKTIDCREVGTVLRALGGCPTEADIQEIIVTCENPEFGNIALSRFLPIVSGMISENRFQPASAEELLKAFRTLDKDNKSYLDKEYLTKLMIEEGEPFTPEEIDEMMSTAVDQDTGRIPYEYYINHIMVIQFINLLPYLFIYYIVVQKSEERL
ncbi:dynein regulatory complex protein 8 [Diaphorina citri]|uniref:Dynein regulatory complex protein 8 n=1 Tax=Diaphorina citri TaxID=121845 RepID=A0A3Q0JAC1_DIACI|nr:dynein regulatory complex protein 8 [Diaphorina citri]